MSKTRKNTVLRRRLALTLAMALAWGAGSGMALAQTGMQPAAEQQPAGQALTPPSEGAGGLEAGDGADTGGSGTTPFARLGIWVGVLTVVFVVLIVILRRLGPNATPKLPPEVFEILGKTPLAYRHQLYLLRCGSKLFLASVSQNGLDRVGEIDDPVEVERLRRLCRGEVLGTQVFGASASRNAPRDGGTEGR